MAPFFVFAKQRRRARKTSVRRLLLETLEERCVLSPPYPYDGTYTGTYTGNVTLNDGSTEAVSGPVAFTVMENLVTATEPFPTDPNNDNGVLAEGAINFLCDNGDTTQGAAGIGFQGQITLTPGAATINGGSWDGEPLGNYQGGSGTWTASTATTPVAGTVIPNAPAFDKVKGGIDYSYQVSGGSLAQDVPIAFYWGSDSIGSATIGTPLFTDTAAAGTTAGTVSDSIPMRNLIAAPPPPNATYLLMVTNPGDTTNQKIAPLKLQFANVTPLYQNQPGSDWAPGGFDDPTDSTKLLNSPSNKTIAQSGCLLTDLTMALNYAGMSYNPLTLNNTLLAANEGFTGGDLYPSIATATAAAASHQTAEWIDFNTSDPQALRNELIQAATPIVVRVTNSTTGNRHYVLVTGLAGNGDFTIDDPGYPSGTRNLLLKTYGSFTAQGYVIDPTDLSVLSFAYVADGSGASLTVTDPAGNVTTIDPTSGQSTQQIPNSFVSVEGPLEDLSGGPAENTTAVIIDVYKPMAGTYEIQTGDQFASSTLTVADVTPSGTVQSLPPQAGQSSGGQPSMQVFLDQTSASHPIVPSKIGVERAAADGSATLSLDSNGDGAFDSGDAVFTFGLATDTFLVGDWAGLGYDSVGVVRPTTSGVAQFSLDSNGDDAFDAGDSVFNFGLNTDTFLVGDWNGSGTSKIGVVRPGADGSPVFSLDTNGDGVFDAGDTVTSFGLNGDTFVIGDWNGAGKAEIGIVRPTASGVLQWVLDTNGDGVYDSGDQVFNFGLNGDTPVVGDWNGSGTTKIGVVRPGANGVAQWSLDTNGDGVFDAGDSAFSFGLNSDNFLIGNWQPPEALYSGAGVLNAPVQPLATDANFVSTINQAIMAWQQAGISAQQVASLETATYSVGTLGDGLLGETSGNNVVLDATAQGHSWSESATPQPGQMDLETALEHEMGHVLGLPDQSTLPNDLMFESLLPGVHKTPTTADVDAAFATLGTRR